MVTDLPSRLTVYIHPKLFDFWHFFEWVEFHIFVDFEKNYSLEKVDIYTHKFFLARL